MCGIAGILNLDDDLRPEAEIAAMTDRLRHRGPDGIGFFRDGNVALGHTRLAIIDLAGGEQPICNEDESIWLTYNGEIYNHRELRRELESNGHTFKTRCDTEVVVHAYEQWGEECVQRFRGMFAFGIWDAKKRRMFLARDRVGIKPLLYFENSSVFAFASELQAFHTLAAFEAEIDLQAIDLYLQFQYIPAPWTAFKSIKKLPPGHTLTIDEQGRQSLRRYWHFQFSPDERLDEASCVEQLADVLQDAVKAHLDSDVPYGAFLSGGVDSSLVVALMAKELNQPVSTFTIGSGEESYDERSYARQVAELVGTEHHEQCVGSDALDLLPRLVQHYGEPFADSSAIPTFLVSQFASTSVKMVLSGDGGDEVFGGYPRHERIQRQNPPLASTTAKLRHGIGNVARGLKLRPSLPWPYDSHFHSTGYFNDLKRQSLWRDDSTQRRETTRAWYESQFSQARRFDPVTNLQHFDIDNFLVYDNLAKVDIASMYHGLEVRVPLLDHHVLEVASRIPTRLRVHADGDHGKDLAYTRKYALKRVAERHFDWGFLNRRKQGFSVPVGPWISNDWRDVVQEKLLNPQSRFSTLFDVSFVRSLNNEHHQSGQHGWRMWSLLFLSEWLEAQSTAKLVTAYPNQ